MRVLSPEPGLTAVLSSLARLDAARVTSPVPPGSPWWAAEAAELAHRAGLHVRARTEAHRALALLLGEPDTLYAIPEQAGAQLSRPPASAPRPSQMRPSDSAKLSKQVSS